MGAGLPARAALAAGVERADSWATDGHKWLQTPYDCGYAIVRDAEAHRRAMTIAASYLPPVAEGERDPDAFRAGAVAPGARLRHLGDAPASRARRHRRDGRAALPAGPADRRARPREPGIAVVNDVVLNQVIVRFGADDDEDTLGAIARLQADGTCFAGGAMARPVGDAALGDRLGDHR